MILKVNNVQVSVLPSKFAFSVMDLDDGDVAERTTDGTMIRERIATKRKLSLGWDLLKWSDASQILALFNNVFVDVYYPDTLTGQYETKTFYAGDRPAALAIDLGDGELWWTGIEFNIVER